MVFPLLFATNSYGKVGNIYSSWTLGVPEGVLKTCAGFRGFTAFNPADLGCPPAPTGVPLTGHNLNLSPKDSAVLQNFALTKVILAASQPDPSVLLPSAITDIDPAWKSCTIMQFYLGIDPPRVMQPANNMVPAATTAEIAPQAAHATP